MKTTEESKHDQESMDRSYNVIDRQELKEYPCQQLMGGTGAAIYSNVDGLCSHPECNPENDDR